MNFHDFVTESFNPEHSFRDAHTVPFCLTADHIATCHLSLCPHQASTVFGLPLDTCCMESVLVTVTTGSGRTRGDVWKRGSFHGVPWTAHFWMRGWWSDTTACNGCSGMYCLTVSQVATDAVVCTFLQCLDSWLRMQWYAQSRQLVLECPKLSIK